MDGGSAAGLSQADGLLTHADMKAPAGRRAGRRADWQADKLYTLRLIQRLSVELSDSHFRQSGIVRKTMTWDFCATIRDERMTSAIIEMIELKKSETRV